MSDAHAGTIEAEAGEAPVLEPTPLAVPPPTGVSQQELNALWNQLLTAGQQEMQDWMRRRVPPLLIPHFEEYWGGAGARTTVAQGDLVRCYSNTGVELPGSPGTCVVVGGMFLGVQMGAALTYAIVQNGQAVSVVNNTLQPIEGSPGVATVSASNLQFVRLAPVDIADPDPTVAEVRDGDIVPIHDADGADLSPAAPPTAKVVDSVLVATVLIGAQLEEK